MQDADFSDEFCNFVQTAIPTIEAVELLLALAARPGAWWDRSEIPAKLSPTLNITDAEATRYLEVFKARELLAVGPDQRIQYRPASPHIASQVQLLTQAYSQRPVTLIRMIYALRDANIRSFADAFRLTRK